MSDYRIKEHTVRIVNAPDEVVKQIRADAIDDLTEKLKDYFVIPHDARVIEMMAEQLKENK